MSNRDPLRFLENMLELAPFTLTGGEALRDLQAWDSLGTMLFIATVDREFGVPLPGNRVIRCQTVDDLCRLIDDAASIRTA